jgi:hypothetical protein
VSNVEKLYPANAAEIADNVLEQAVGAYDTVLIIGWNKEGVLEARATTDLADGAECMWLIESFKAKLMSGDFSDEGA